MAIATNKASISHSPLNLGSLCSFPLIYFLNLPYRILAQTPSDQDAPPRSDIAGPDSTPALIVDPTSPQILSEASSAAAASHLIPTSTDSANYAPHNNHTNADHRHVINYYFLLLAIFVVVLALVYWIVARRRHKRLMAARSVQQSALAQDLQTWSGRRRGVGRWRGPAGETRAEEGLDERGEAPPPYLKEPEPVHQGRGDEEVELHDMSRAEGKPPNYGEVVSRS